MIISNFRFWKLNLRNFSIVIIHKMSLFSLNEGLRGVNQVIKNPYFWATYQNLCAQKVLLWAKVESCIDLFTLVTWQIYKSIETSQYLPYKALFDGNKQGNINPKEVSVLTISLFRVSTLHSLTFAKVTVGMEGKFKLSYVTFMFKH